MYGDIQAATLVEHHPRYFFPDSYSRLIASQIANCTLSVYGGAGADFMSDFSAARDFLAGSASLVEEDASGARTIMFTDLEASTALTQRIGDRGAQDVVHRHDVIVRAALEDHGGREIKRTGDGIMASFHSAVDAVVAAQQIRDAALQDGIGVRVGLNTGEPIVEDGDLFGTAVQLAARITDHAEPGQVLVSNVVRELCAGKGLVFEAIGPTAMKGFDEPVQLYSTGAARPSRPLANG
jgi:class 3 adenylate cyclase